MTGSPGTPLPPDLAAQLDQLRDIHLPAPISWWPLAYGWWVVIGLGLAAAIGLVAYREIRRRTIRHRALQELARLGATEQADTASLARDVATLLKRLVKIKDPVVAADHGDAWVRRLQSGPAPLPDRIARYLAQAPYAPLQAANTDAPVREDLIVATRAWIKRNA